MSDIRYNSVYWPAVVMCENCGHTARPVHKHTFPPDPDTVYCPFCGEIVPLTTETEPTYARYELSKDGTLSITVPNGISVNRILLTEDGTHWGGLFYPDDGD